MHRSGDSTRSVLVSGAGGLIGSTVCDTLSAEGWLVLTLVRHKPRSPRQRQWDPQSDYLSPAIFEGVDAVIHLAGEPLLGVWTAAKKRRIRSSRVNGTRVLCEALAQPRQRPTVLVCASAVGFYGDRGDEILTETSDSGEGFLAETCRQWESACDPARAAGVRTVNLRLGMVLSGRGGALPAMLPIYRLGLGGPIGQGRQWISWIALADAAAVIRAALDRADLHGPINAVSPEPAQNKDFAEALAEAMDKPALGRLPSAAAKLLTGDMAREMLLASTRAIPARLSDAGHTFAYPHLPTALAGALART